MRKPFRLTSIFILVFIVFISWTSAFAISGWLTIPVIVSILITVIFSVEFGIFLIKKKELKHFRISVFNIILSTVLVMIILNCLFKTNSKTLNYLLSYFYVYFITFFLMKFVIHNYINLDKILLANFIGVLAIVLFVAFEFLLKVLLDIDIQDFIPRTFTAKAIYSDLFLPRSTGFSEEPTYLSWYFNTCGLLAIWTILTKKYFNGPIGICFIVLFCFSYITTFSAAGIGLLLISFLVLNILNFKEKIIHILVFVLLSLLIYLFVIYNDLGFVFEPIVNKLLLKQDNEGDRLPLWIDTFSNNSNFLFGKGLGYYSSIGRESPVNYFLFLFLETGLFPVLGICYFYGYIFNQYLKKDSDMLLKVAYLSGVGHLFTQSLFFHPTLWFLIIVIIKISKYKYESNTSISLGSK